MSFNPQNFIRIREEYENKAEKARQEADIRRAQLEMIFPEFAKINRELMNTGLLIMDAIMKNPENLEARLAKIEADNQALLAKKREILKNAGYPEDYDSVHYECEACGDTGYADGKMCKCMRRALILAGYESSGIANLLAKQSFESFSLDYYKNNKTVYEKMSRVLSETKAFTTKFKGKNSGNLAFFGGTGVGKTHLSSAVARELIDSGYDVMYTTAIGMMSDFEYQRFGSTVSTEISPTSRYFECDLLIIDDLGTEIANQFTVTTLYNVIDTRLKTGKSMLISTNLSQDEMRKRYWDRITSRIFGEFHVLGFAGIDVRQQKLKV